MSLSVAFVTHAGPGIGLGHVRRCLALARAWAPEGADLAFLAPGAGAALERAAPELRAAGAARVDVVLEEWERDAGPARARIGEIGADVVVVDSYAVTPAFAASLAEVAGRVVAVDDLADRPLPAHVVVNGGVAAESLGYDRAGAPGRTGPDTRYLLGPRYALIDPRFGERPPESPSRPSVRSVLIALGGAPAPEMLAAAVDAVLEAAPGASVDVVAGPFSPRIAGARVERVTVHGDPPDMRALMRAVDLAVTGAGVTLYELAATGIPAVVVEIADNQGPNAAGFAAAGAAVLAGRAGDAALRDGIAAAVSRLAHDPALRAALAGRGRALVDGRGALRAAREIAAMVPAAGRVSR